MCDVIEVETQNNLQYVFIPVSSSALRFKVKAANDAHIALIFGEHEGDPITELRIGGWGNTKSSVRRNRTKPDKVEVLTPGILSREQYVAIWVRWYDDCVAAGLEGSEIPFMAYKDPCPHRIDHVGVRTGWGACGSWKIEVTPILLKSIIPKPLDGELRWLPMMCHDKIPPGAVVGGFEGGEMLFVARSIHNQSMHLGKYVPSAKHVFICWQNRVHKKDTFEILCGNNLKWVKMKDDALPPHAIPGGTCFERNNETLFIGRAHIENDLIPGTISLQTKACYIPCGSETEKIAQVFEVLVIPEKMPEQLIWHTPKKRRTSATERHIMDRMEHMRDLLFRNQYMP